MKGASGSGTPDNSGRTRYQSFNANALLPKSNYGAQQQTTGGMQVFGRGGMARSAPSAPLPLSLPSLKREASNSGVATSNAMWGRSPSATVASSSVAQSPSSSPKPTAGASRPERVTNLKSSPGGISASNAALAWGGKGLLNATRGVSPLRQSSGAASPPERPHGAGFKTDTPPQSAAYERLGMRPTSSDAHFPALGAEQLVKGGANRLAGARATPVEDSVSSSGGGGSGVAGGGVNNGGHSHRQSAESADWAEEVSAEEIDGPVQAKNDESLLSFEEAADGAASLNVREQRNSSIASGVAPPADSLTVSAGLGHAREGEDQPTGAVKRGSSPLVSEADIEAEYEERRQHGLAVAAQLADERRRQDDELQRQQKERASAKLRELEEKIQRKRLAETKQGGSDPLYGSAGAEEKSAPPSDVDVAATTYLPPDVRAPKNGYALAAADTATAWSTRPSEASKQWPIADGEKSASAYTAKLAPGAWADPANSWHNNVGAGKSVTLPVADASFKQDSAASGSTASHGSRRATAGGVISPTQARPSVVDAPQRRLTSDAKPMLLRRAPPEATLAQPLNVTAEPSSVEESFTSKAGEPLSSHSQGVDSFVGPAAERSNAPSSVGGDFPDAALPSAEHPNATSTPSEADDAPNESLTVDGKPLRTKKRPNRGRKGKVDARARDTAAASATAPLAAAYNALHISDYSAANGDVSAHAAVKEGMVVRGTSESTTERRSKPTSARGDGALVDDLASADDQPGAVRARRKSERRGGRKAARTVRVGNESSETPPTTTATAPERNNAASHYAAPIDAEMPPMTSADAYTPKSRGRGLQGYRRKDRRGPLMAQDTVDGTAVPREQLQLPNHTVSRHAEAALKRAPGRRAHGGAAGSANSARAAHGAENGVGGAGGDHFAKNGLLPEGGERSRGGVRERPVRRSSRRVHAAAAGELATDDASEFANLDDGHRRRDAGMTADGEAMSTPSYGTVASLLRDGAAESNDVVQTPLRSAPVPKQRRNKPRPVRRARDAAQADGLRGPSVASEEDVSHPATTSAGAAGDAQISRSHDDATLMSAAQHALPELTGVPEAGAGEGVGTPTASAEIAADRGAANRLSRSTRSKRRSGATRKLRLSRASDRSSPGNAVAAEGDTSAAHSEEGAPTQSPPPGGRQTSRVSAVAAAESEVGEPLGAQNEHQSTSEEVPSAGGNGEEKSVALIDRNDGAQFARDAATGAGRGGARGKRRDRKSAAAAAADAEVRGSTSEKPGDDGGGAAPARFKPPRASANARGKLRRRQADDARFAADVSGAPVSGDASTMNDSRLAPARRWDRASKPSSRRAPEGHTWVASASGGEAAGEATRAPQPFGGRPAGEEHKGVLDRRLRYDGSRRGRHPRSSRGGAQRSPDDSAATTDGVGAVPRGAETMPTAKAQLIAPSGERAPDRHFDQALTGDGIDRDASLEAAAAAETIHGEGVHESDALQRKKHFRQGRGRRGGRRGGADGTLIGPESSAPRGPDGSVVGEHKVDASGAKEVEID